jgi:hypothetical protein
MKRKQEIIIGIIVIIVTVIILGYILVENINKKENSIESIDTNIELDNSDEDIDWLNYEMKNLTLTESITITEEGIYELSGEITNGMITVNTKGNVKLILNNVTITNESGPTIYIKNAKNTVIYLKEETTNTLEDSSNYQTDEDINATIYSKDNLIFDGSGTLVIKANYQDGIVSKDNLKIKNGTFNITSIDDSIKGKDSVYIIDGNFNITSGGDGIKSTNTSDKDKGYVYIENGNFEIDATLDGIQAISKWESAIAYPEMDKIIFLCDKFHLNIDDLLHKDIKEIKKEEEGKRKINNFIDDFLKFITDTINLFSNMNLRSKIKCLLEQVIITLILLIISIIIVYGINRLSLNILIFIPYQLAQIITNILTFILVIFCSISSLVILTHTFKTRYLDYYLKLTKESKEKNIEELNRIDEEKKVSFNRKNKILFSKNENKIIIRDPKHSEYKFINGLFKLIIGIIKFFMLLFALLISFILIGLVFSFILSFLVYKTGFFFIGLLLAILSLSIITIVLLLLLLNFTSISYCG